MSKAPIVVKVVLRTRCGCERITQTQFPPQPELRAPLKRKVTVGCVELDDLSKPTMEMRVFGLVDYVIRKGKCSALYEEVGG